MEDALHELPLVHPELPLRSSRKDHRQEWSQDHGECRMLGTGLSNKLGTFAKVLKWCLSQEHKLLFPAATNSQGFPSLTKDCPRPPFVQYRSPVTCFMLASRTICPLVLPHLSADREHQLSCLGMWGLWKELILQQALETAANQSW